MTPDSTASAAARPSLCDDVRLLASADPAAVERLADKTARATPPNLAPPPRAPISDAVLLRSFPSRRDFSASDGTRWCVHERDASGMHGARGAHCLVFETGNVLRVVWRYPREWRTLDDAALEALANAI